MRLSRNISKPRRNLKLANAQDVRRHIPSVMSVMGGERKKKSRIQGVRSEW